MFSKGFLFSFLFFLVFFISSQSLFHFNRFGLIYRNLKFLDNFIIGFKFDFFAFYFLLMVSIVTCLVLVYSEIYMEAYLNFKFLIFTYFFFFRILVLSCSSSPITLIIGWDFLGVSSILLVMFYSNKTTLANRILTIYFNRLGDVFLIFSLCVFINFGSIMLFSFKAFSFLLIVFLVLCSFTKRAQFPFSRWLPAAISAPTPISAIVHSSTLVTAGVWLIFNIQSSIFYFNLCYFFSFFSILRFVLGGLMANFECDFKKLVAFSTLRQISLILLFIFLSFKEIAARHMLFHSLFKSSLFCFCGILFISFFSDQNFLKIESISSKFLVSCFIFSTFSMTGLIFSSSFFRKDMVIEFFLSRDYFFLFFFFLLGSLFTLLYCGKILAGLVSKGVNFSFLFKNFHRKFIIIFLMVMFFRFSSLKLFNLRYFNFIGFTDLFILNIIFIIFILLSLDSHFKFFFFSNLQISFMKYYTFVFFGFLFKNFKDYFFKDDFFFSKFYFNFKSSHFSIFNFSILNLSLFAFLIYFCSYSLIGT